MAEKQTLPNAYAITLTYADKHGKSPLGARVFRYKDVELFWKRLRAAGTKLWGRFEMRYIIVGEKGTLNGRCHYHGVIFSDRPIHELGEISSLYGNGITYSSGKRKVRHNWTIWGHGFVDFQRPDRKGMSYVLKYILKGRMTAARSEGFNRQGRTEWLASSTLWCSTGRSIGEKWLFSKVAEMIGNNRMPTSLLFRVPDGGEWYIGGPLRHKLCLFLHGLAVQREKAGLPDYAGWSTLLTVMGKDIKLTTGGTIKSKSYEVLLNGEEKEKYRDAWDDHDRRESDERSRKHWAAYRAENGIEPIDPVFEQFTGCFGIRSCKSCEAARAYQKVYEDNDVEKIWRGYYSNEADGSESFPPFDDWITRQGLVSYGCIKARQDGGRVKFYAARREQAYRQKMSKAS